MIEEEDEAAESKLELKSEVSALLEKAKQLREQASTLEKKV